MPIPNEVKLAVVGCGYWGKNLVRTFARLGALGAVADTVSGRADEAAQKYNVPALAYAEALADPSISAVVLATPAEQHAEMALKALAAGKHVFVEKPVALAVGDGERILRAARAADRQVMVGHLLRYHPAFLKLLELTQAGELGRLQYIYSNRLNLGRIRREENVFWSFAPHDISMILALAGEAPTRVRGIGSSYLHQQIADVTATHLTFASGMNAHIFVSWLHPCKEQKLVVIGDRGMAVFNDGEDWERKLTLFRHHIDWRNGLPEPARAEAESVPLSPAEPLEVECAHFIDCVANDRTPRTDANEGLAVLRVLAAAVPALLPAAAGNNAGTLGEGVFAHSSACIDENCTIGDGTRIWHFSHILSGSHIGRNCTIGQNVMIGPGVSIGDGCKVQNNVSIYKGVVLEDAVFCGPSCVFTNVTNPRAEVERKSEFRPTHVGRGATIGANATIVCGHTLGQYSLVGAGAVVTRDVPAFAVVAGNPARRIGWVSHAGERLGPDLVCPRTGQRYYQLGDDFLVEAEAREGERAMLDG